MPDKSWTATDVATVRGSYQVVTGDFFDSAGLSAVKFEAQYCYSDDLGMIPDLAHKTYAWQDTVGGLPIGVLEALQTLDVYMKDQAREYEGMN